MSDDVIEVDEAPVRRSGAVALTHFGPPPKLTQKGPRGIRFDFNEGCRVQVPAGDQWHLTLRDLDTGNILFDTTFAGGTVHSSKKYYVRFRVEVSAKGENIFVHDYDARDKAVLVLMPVRTLGDTVAWMPQVAKFQARHGCRLTCAMAGWLIPLFRDAYPHIAFITPEEVRQDYYATYKVMIYFGEDKYEWQPSDYQHVGLRYTAAHMLGIDGDDEPPLLGLHDEGRPIAERYVCIGTQSTAQCKQWNNPHGWRAVIAFLKQAGYRVICIDQKAVNGHGLVWNHIPNGAEDETGDRPLMERARWLRHADFFIGLSSGLSWLAWAARTPVVLISGFTHPINEFATPYRVINYHACNSCWNDLATPFDNRDYLVCPRHKDTPRQFECSRLITADQVIDTIRRIPSVAAHTATAPRAS